MKVLSFFVLVLALSGFGCSFANKSAYLSNRDASKSNIEVKPVFDASALIGKNPAEVDRVLGSPTDSWTMRSYPNGEGKMRVYALGEETTVEFHEDQIATLVIFFSQKNVDPETAYRLVGLDLAKPKPTGIWKITTGNNWIKLYYGFEEVR
jgi:hypothetical protein